MADTSHLERMGRELKCPICLSLLNSAVSLTCNHAFCISCIEKSMKSASNCPVCKVPFRRREVRPAPHMDNLVSIYKSMEVALGVNIFVTQTTPSTKLSGGQNQPAPAGICGIKEEGRTCTETLGQENQRRFKRRGSKGSSKTSKSSSSNLVRPSFPTKKRVQVTQYPPPETPMQPAKCESGMGETTKDGPQKSSFSLKDKLTLNEMGEPVFSPFFWLREEEDVEKMSQLTYGEHVTPTPPNAPCFSDIKDSDDEPPFKMTSTSGTCDASNDTDSFDSDMIEWTQRACSPELCSSPMTMQVEDTDEFGGIQEKECKTALRDKTTYRESITGNSKSMIPDEIDNLEVSLPALSSPRTKNAKNKGGINKSKKRVRKESESRQKKRAKRTLHGVLGIQIDSQEVVENNTQATCGKDDNIRNVKEKTLKRDKNVGYDASAAETLQATISTSSAVEKPLHQGDKIMVSHLSASLDLKEGSQEFKKRGRSSRKTMAQKRRECAKSKTQKHITFKDTITQGLGNEILISCSYAKSSPVNDDNEVSNLSVKVRKSGVKKISDPECDRKVKCLKKVKFSMENMSKDKFHDDYQQIHGNVVAKETRSLRKVQGNSDISNMDDPLKTEKGVLTSNGVVLRKCETVSDKIGCAFCQLAEDSEASGEMVHYPKGKPVIADYNRRSNIIHVHRNCTEWAPNVYFEGDNAINLEAELARSQRIKCCCCGIKGAALGCYEKNCRKSFHVPCAKLTPECRWDNDNFVMLCPLHASLKLPNETSGSKIIHKKRHATKRQSHIHQHEVTIKHDNNKGWQWNSHGSFEKLFLCCSALTNAEKETISEFERLTGVTVLKNWDSSVTHVIASTDENRACKRTLKFLMGVLEGKWILTIEWVKACLQAMDHVDELHYEIEMDIHGIRDGPRLGRLRLLNKQPKIFSGCMFYFIGDFVPSYKGYLHDLVIAAGGMVLHRKPISAGQEALSSGCSRSQTFIIYSLELPDKCDPMKINLFLNRRRSDAEVLASSTGSVAASNSWVLNSIAACQLQNFAE